MSLVTKIAKLTTLGVGCLLGTVAQAVVLTYDNWNYNSSYEIDWVVTVDDESNAGQFTFNVSIGDSSLLGDIVGFGFDTGLDYGSSILDDVTNYSSYTFGNCSGNCNWNGTGIRPDYAFSVGSNGATDFVTSFSFGVDSLGSLLTADTFSLVAIRGQSVGDDREGSVKDFSASTSVHTAPELSASLAPVSIALLAGLMLMGVERRRRKI